MSFETEIVEIRKAAESAGHDLLEFGRQINAEGYTPSKEDLDKFTELEKRATSAQAAFEAAASKREDERGRIDRMNALARTAEFQKKFESFDYAPRNASEESTRRESARELADRVAAAWMLAGAAPDRVTNEDAIAAKRLGADPFAEQFCPLPMATVALPDGSSVRVPNHLAAGGAFGAHREFLQRLHSHVVRHGASYANEFVAAADAVGDSRDVEGYGRLNQLPTVLTTLEANMVTYGGILDHPISIMVTDDYEDILQDYYDDTANKARQLAEGATIGENKRAALGRYKIGYFDYTSDDFEVTNRQLERSRYNLPAMIGAALGERHGRKMAEVLTSGNGSSEPDGAITAAKRDAFITQTAGNSKIVTTASSTAIAYDELCGTGPEYKLDQMWTVGPSVGWSMHRTTLGYLETLKDSDLYPIFQLGKEPTTNRRTLRNYPIFFNYAMDSGITAGKYVIAFGDWGRVELRRAGGGVPIFIRDTTSKRRELKTIFTAVMSYDQRLKNFGNMPLSLLRMKP